MDNNVRRQMALSQIDSLRKLALERDPSFDDSWLNDESLKSMSFVDLERVHRTLREIVYSPPARN